MGQRVRMNGDSCACVGYRIDVPVVDQGGPICHQPFHRFCTAQVIGWISVRICIVLGDSVIPGHPIDRRRILNLLPILDPILPIVLEVVNDQGTAVANQARIRDREVHEGLAGVDSVSQSRSWRVSHSLANDKVVRPGDSREISLPLHEQVNVVGAGSQAPLVILRRHRQSICVIVEQFPRVRAPRTRQVGKRGHFQLEILANPLREEHAIPRSQAIGVLRIEAGRVLQFEAGVDHCHGPLVCYGACVEQRFQTVRA